MKNEEIFKNWFEEVWNNHIEASIEKLLTKSCIVHGLLDDEGNEVIGPDKFKQMFRKFIASFPDIHVDVLQTINEGNRIAGLVAAKFTHSGASFEAFPGKLIEPSGKTIEFSGITIALMEDGKIKEAWNNSDFLSLYAKLGAF